MSDLPPLTPEMFVDPTARRATIRVPAVTQILSESQDKDRGVIEAVLEDVRALLPENYKVSYNSLTEQFMISGHDVAGWTLDEYVIPRLASGLIFAEEVK